MIALPQYIDVEIWSAFVSQRGAMKVPFTQQAQKLVVMKLMKLHADGYDANAILEKSAIYGYRSVFPDDKLKKAAPVVSATYVDPAIQKIDDDRKKAVPMPDHVRKQLQQLRGKTHA